MTQQEIKQAIAGLSRLLGGNPEVLQQQLGMLKALIPGLDEETINRMIQKTKEPDFNPYELEKELQSVVSAIRQATSQ